MLCEGVMGLFDGTGPDGEAGSTAALARLTGWPVVLVVDARRQGASAAALVAGFARHDPAVPLAGVIFNRVAGSRHLALLEAALARHLPALPCLGAVMQDPALSLPERHLGLVPAGERQSGTEAAIARAAARGGRRSRHRAADVAGASGIGRKTARRRTRRCRRSAAISRWRATTPLSSPIRAC